MAKASRFSFVFKRNRHIHNQYTLLVMADPSVQPTDTLFLGNLHFSVDREILYEIGIQAGPVTKVVVPMDPATNRSKGFGFIVSDDGARLPRPRRPHRRPSPAFAAL